jgi:hypothetical protein
MKTRVGRFGAFLAGMVVPNIAAFIAWGLLTALVIPAGWLPSPRLAKLVDPTILYLLPLLIGFAGGRLVHGNRGGVVGAIAVMGVVVGSTVPMFLGAMIMGPLGGWGSSGPSIVRSKAAFRLVSKCWCRTFRPVSPAWASCWPGTPGWNLRHGLPWPCSPHGRRAAPFDRVDYRAGQSALCQQRYTAAHK